KFGTKLSGFVPVGEIRLPEGLQQCLRTNGVQPAGLRWPEGLLHPREVMQMGRRPPSVPEVTVCDLQDVCHENAGQSLSGGVPAPAVDRHRLHHPVEVLMELAVVTEVGPVALADRVEDHEHYPRNTPAYARG